MWFVNGINLFFLFFVLGWFCDWEDRALQECNLSARPSVDSEGIHPGSP